MWIEYQLPCEREAPSWPPEWHFRDFGFQHAQADPFLTSVDIVHRRQGPVVSEIQCRSDTRFANHGRLLSDKTYKTETIPMNITK